MRVLHVIPVAVAVSALVAPGGAAQRSARPAVIDLWITGPAGLWRVRAQREPIASARAGRCPGPSAGQGGLPPRLPVPERPDAAQARTRPKPLYTEAGGEKLAANPLYDYVFLNLEGAYDSAAVKAIATGLKPREAPAAAASP